VVGAPDASWTWAAGTLSQVHGHAGLEGTAGTSWQGSGAAMCCSSWWVLSGAKKKILSVENPMGMETQQNAAQNHQSIHYVLFSRLSTLHSPPPGAASSAFSRGPLQQLSITPSWLSVGIFVD